MRTSKLCWESTYSDYILCGKKYRYFGRFLILFSRYTKSEIGNVNY